MIREGGNLFEKGGAIRNLLDDMEDLLAHKKLTKAMFRDNSAQFGKLAGLFSFLSTDLQPHVSDEDLDDLDGADHDEL